MYCNSILFLLLVSLLSNIAYLFYIFFSFISVVAIWESNLPQLSPKIECCNNIKKPLETKMKDLEFVFKISLGYLPIKFCLSLYHFIFSINNSRKKRIIKSYIIFSNTHKHPLYCRKISWCKSFAL